MLVIAGEVRVPERHTDILVPHQGLHRRQTGTAHDQLTRNGMAQVMEGKISPIGLVYHTCKRRAERPLWLIRMGPKH